MSVTDDRPVFRLRLSLREKIVAFIRYWQLARGQKWNPYTKMKIVFVWMKAPQLYLFTFFLATASKGKSK